MNCPDCDGATFYKDYCENCDATGMVDGEDCGNCDGSGVAEYECDTCVGMGQVEEDEEE